MSQGQEVQASDQRSWKVFPVWLCWLTHSSWAAWQTVARPNISPLLWAGWPSPLKWATARISVLHEPVPLANIQLGSDSANNVELCVCVCEWVRERENITWSLTEKLELAVWKWNELRTWAIWEFSQLSQCLGSVFSSFTCSFLTFYFSLYPAGMQFHQLPFRKIYKECRREQGRAPLAFFYQQYWQGNRCAE